MKPISIEQVMGACADSFALEIRSRGITLDWQSEPALVAGDEDGLRQVLDNLLKNALLYNRGGWVKMEGEVREPYYKVTVVNIGQPIPAEQAERLFERFYRLDSSRNRETGGSGLGLALVKEIIGQHQGQVGVESDGDRHSFWFTMPLTGSADAK
ncbi:sensor histidine kinase [Brevibacillus sp. B_LB10_24]|uniref:sensor histidine kinase n=1 Tax=Brevibacillus sp. B_LB10_24 TaxID=3380645 RepID=UPI0038BD6290